MSKLTNHVRYLRYSNPNPYLNLDRLKFPFQSDDVVTVNEAAVPVINEADEIRKACRAVTANNAS